MTISKHWPRLASMILHFLRSCFYKIEYDSSMLFFFLVLVVGFKKKNLIFFQKKISWWIRVPIKILFRYEVGTYEFYTQKGIFLLPLFIKQWKSWDIPSHWANHEDTKHTHTHRIVHRIYSGLFYLFRKWEKLPVRDLLPKNFLSLN